MYKKLLTASFLLLLTSTAWAQSKTIGTFEFEAKYGSHTARIVMQTVRFDPTKHKVVINRSNQTIIDGRPAFGTDASIPDVEIASIKFYVDKKEIRISKRLYSDCYEPQPDARSFKVHFNRNTRIVIVEMHGSDAAASYTVKWQLKTNGHHKRSAYQDFSAEDLKGGEA